MKNLPLLVVLVFLNLVTYSKDNSDESSLEVIVNNILDESEILYRYEKVTWNSTDLAMNNIKLRSEFYGYLIYNSSDTLKAIILDAMSNCIAEYSYTTDINKPVQTNLIKRPHTLYESKLLKIKMLAFKAVTKKKYKVSSPPGLSPNVVFIPDGETFKVYVIQGTTSHNIIPLGNDHFFRINEKGKVLDWIQYHKSNLHVTIPEERKGQLHSLTHSHKIYPYISPTDICTVRLYGPQNGLKEFSVLSTKLGKYFTYNLETNTIIIKD